jgi:hypothetical protein
VILLLSFPNNVETLTLIPYILVVWAYCLVAFTVNCKDKLLEKEVLEQYTCYLVVHMQFTIL